MRALTVLLFALASTGLLAASAPSPPNSPKGLVERGANAYIKGDASAAIAAWVKDGPMEANPQAMTQANVLRQVQDFYGKPVGFDVLRQADVSEKNSTVYFTINFEKGPAFAKLNAYKKASGTWVTTGFFFHTEANQVFPNALLGLD